MCIFEDRPIFWCVIFLYENPILRTSVTRFLLWANVNIYHFLQIQVSVFRHFLYQFMLDFFVTHSSKTSSVLFMLYCRCFAVARILSSPGWPSFSWISFAWNFRVAVFFGSCIFLSLGGFPFLLDGYPHFRIQIIGG